MVMTTETSTEIIFSGETLPQCVEGITRAQQTIEQSAATMLDSACEAGRLLTVAKSQLGHGQFGKWLEKHFEFTDRTARLYMRIFNNWGQLLDYRVEHPKLTFSEAVAYLSEPRAEPADDSKRKSISDLDIDKLYPNWAELREQGTRFSGPPSAGEILIGLFLAPGCIAVVEDYPFDSRFVRTANLRGNLLTFDKRPFDRAWFEYWPKYCGFDVEDCVWFEPRPATPENNPFAEMVPEWRYPQEDSDGDDHT